MIQSINWQLFELLNAPTGKNPLLDQVMIFGASDAILFVPLLFLALWFGCATWSPLANAKVTHDANWQQQGQFIALTGIIAIILALLLNVALGYVFYEPRPFVAYPSLVHKLIAHPPDASFPSDHMAVLGATISMLCSFWFCNQNQNQNAIPSMAIRRYSILLLCINIVVLLWVGTARVYVGVHYPGDILGGVLCGIGGWLIAQRLGRPCTPVFTFIREKAREWKIG